MKWKKDCPCHHKSLNVAVCAKLFVWLQLIHLALLSHVPIIVWVLRVPVFILPIFTAEMEGLGSELSTWADEASLASRSKRREKGIRVKSSSGSQGSKPRSSKS